MHITIETHKLSSSENTKEDILSIISVHPQK